MYIKNKLEIFPSSFHMWMVCKYSARLCSLGMYNVSHSCTVEMLFEESSMTTTTVQLGRLREIYKKGHHLQEVIFERLFWQFPTPPHAYMGSLKTGRTCDNMERLRQGASHQIPPVVENGARVSEKRTDTKSDAASKGGTGVIRTKQLR